MTNSLEILMLNILFIVGIVMLSITVYKQYKLAITFKNGLRFYRRSLTFIVATILVTYIYLEIAYFFLFIGYDDVWFNFVSGGIGMLIITSLLNLGIIFRLLIYENSKMEFLSLKMWRNKFVAIFNKK